jgi:hypothetical protein
MNCEREIVANSEIGNVVRCSCGTVTLNCLCASVRMPSEAFLRLAVMVDEAVASIAARQLAPDDSAQGNHMGGDAAQ